VRTRVKICGITRAQDAMAAVRAGADALGFVMWPGSPRQVTPAQALAIARDVPALVTRVGVFVDETPRAVAAAVRAAGLHAVQLHGDEDPERYRSCGATLIKAVSLVDAADVARALASADDVTLLVDARDIVRRGGTGRLANWSLARTLARARPILLAGGLDAGNVGAAIRAVRPWGVDVSSGVETAPGRKSTRKITALMARIAKADREGQ
jgi:phosphoribosylanthranilate isomerase